MAVIKYRLKRKHHLKWWYGRHIKHLSQKAKDYILFHSIKGPGVKMKRAGSFPAVVCNSAINWPGIVTKRLTFPILRDDTIPMVEDVCDIYILAMDRPY